MLPAMPDRACTAAKKGRVPDAAMTELSQEKPADWWEVEALFDLCFVPGREALSSYRLRDGTAPLGDMCLVERDEAGILGGAVRSWGVAVGGAAAVLFGPVAVHPTRQGEGLGALLVYRSIEIAKAAGWQRMMLVGDASYYGRFGFRVLPDVMMPPPTNPARVLGLDLQPGAWAGARGSVTKPA